METKYLYTGQQYDALTELYSLRARYYDPGQGSFLSRDTWTVEYQNPVEYNRYGYTAGNPVNLYDPSGYQAAKQYGAALTIGLGVAASLTWVGLWSNAAFRDLVWDAVEAIVDAMTKTRTRDVFGDYVNSDEFDITPLDNPGSNQEHETERQRECCALPTDPPDDEKNGRKDVALGIADADILRYFALNLNVILNPFDITVHPYFGSIGVHMGKRVFALDWQKAGLSSVPPEFGLLSGRNTFPQAFDEATRNAAVIHFNLEGIRNKEYNKFADLSTGSFDDRVDAKGNRIPVTAIELNIVRSRPDLCSKTVFYEQGSVYPPIPSLSAKIEICGRG